MKKALVLGNRICDIALDAFPVAPTMIWVDVPDETTTLDTYINGAVVKFQPQPDATYVWNGTTWVQDPALVAAVADLARLQSELTAAKLIPEVTLLLNATPAQIDAWFANNATTVAQQRAAMIILTKIIAIIGRQAFK